MEGYEIYRLSDEEIQHFGVKGMKWGKRKSRSSYMKKVDAHEQKGKDIANAKSKEKSDKRAINAEASAKREVKGAARKQLAKAQAKDLSEKLSKGLNIAIAVNDVYGDISPTGLKNHIANAEQLEKYGIKYNP